MFRKFEKNEISGGFSVNTFFLEKIYKEILLQYLLISSKSKTPPQYSDTSPKEHVGKVPPPPRTSYVVLLVHLIKNLLFFICF